VAVGGKSGMEKPEKGAVMAIGKKKKDASSNKELIK